MQYLPPFIAGKVPSVFVGKQNPFLISALPDFIFMQKQAVFPHRARQFDFCDRFCDCSKQVSFRLGDLLNIHFRKCQQFCQKQIFIRFYCRTSGIAVHFAGIGWNTENLFRMLGKVFIDPHNSCIIRCFYRLQVDERLFAFRTFLKNKDVCHNFRSDFFKCVVRQTDRGKQGGS